MKIARTVVFAILLLGGLSAWTENFDWVEGVSTSKFPAAQNVYECFRTDEKIAIDGIPDERAWEKAKTMKLVGIIDGSEEPSVTDIRLLWDSDYLYFSFRIIDPDLRAYWAFSDLDIPKCYMEARFGKDWIEKRKKSSYGSFQSASGELKFLERFAKLFLDPDGDGWNYMEWQINPLNRVFTGWYNHGNKETGRRPPIEVHAEWTCPGLLSAVRLDGTLNNSSDVDRGWSGELAIPWSAVIPFCKSGKRPKAGDCWGMHSGRVHRVEPSAPNEYWTWPQIGICDSHRPTRYGKMIFRDNLKKFNRVIGWVLNPTEENFKQASSIGITDAAIERLPDAKTIALGKKYGIALYPKIMPIARKPEEMELLQKLLPEEEELYSYYEGRDLEKNNRLAGVIKTARRQRDGFSGGGEPGKRFWSKTPKMDVTFTKNLCFANPKTKAIMRERLDALCKGEGIAGIAFDGVGFRNYHGCFCDICNAEFEKAKKENPKLTRDEFSLKQLVDFNNEMIDYVKQKRPELKTLCHIWPVFNPMPLYGHLLNYDFCGETAAWYTAWDPWKIRKYTREIVKYPAGVPFIGYFSKKRMGLFPYRTPERVEYELRSILLEGGDRIMFCGIDDVLRDPEVKEVFRRLVRKR